MDKQIRITITLPDHTPTAAMRPIADDLQDAIAAAAFHNLLTLPAEARVVVDAIVTPDTAPSAPETVTIPAAEYRRLQDVDRAARTRIPEIPAPSDLDASSRHLVPDAEWRAYLVAQHDAAQAEWIALAGQSGHRQWLAQDDVRAAYRRMADAAADLCAFDASTGGAR